MIFARCGAEAGKAKRVLDENLISWGYYVDHDPFAPHCNAHPNNFVVMDPSNSPYNNLLAMVDLDMAFEFSNFVNTMRPNPELFTDAENLQIQSDRYMTCDRILFDDWCNSEKYELEAAIGGLENMMNFSYAAKTDSAESESKLN